MRNKLPIAIFLVTLFFLFAFSVKKQTFFKINKVNDSKKNVALVSAVPLYRIVDQWGYHRFATTKGIYYKLITDYAKLYRYKPEGIIGYVFDSKVQGTDRLFCSMKSIDGKGADFFYTMAEDETVYARSTLGYSDATMVVDENNKIVAQTIYISPTQLPGTTPLYRIRQNFDIPGHFYTSNLAERNQVLADKQNYQDEGIAGYIWTSQVQLSQ